MLNATHQDWTSANIRHGLSDPALRGKHDHQHGRERSRAGALPATKRPPDSLVGNPGMRGPAADHRDVASQGRRLSLDQPTGLCASVPAPAHCLVSAARVRSYALRFGLGATAWGARYGHFKRYPLSAFGIPR